MDFFKMTDEEILKIADPIWDNIIIGSNTMNYSAFSKDFAKGMLEALSEKEVKKQWLKSPELTNLAKERIFLACLRIGSRVRVLWKQKSTKINGEYLGWLTLAEEEGSIKVIGACIK